MLWKDFILRGTDKLMADDDDGGSNENKEK